MLQNQHKTQYIWQICGEIKQFNVEIAILCENIFEEGYESKFGSEEGWNVFGLWIMYYLYDLHFLYHPHDLLDYLNDLNDLYHPHDLNDIN